MFQGIKARLVILAAVFALLLGIFSIIAVAYAQEGSPPNGGMQGIEQEDQGQVNDEDQGQVDDEDQTNGERHPSGKTDNVSTRCQR